MQKDFVSRTPQKLSLISQRVKLTSVRGALNEKYLEKNVKLNP